MATEQLGALERLEAKIDIIISEQARLERRFVEFRNWYRREAGSGPGKPHQAAAAALQVEKSR